MKEFDVIWKFSVLGFLLAITLSLGFIKIKIDDIEKLLVITDTELPCYNDSLE
jgi:hypothetical protein